MASNIPKPSRGARIASLQKLVDGFTVHGAKIPRVVICGRAMSPQEFIDELNVMIAVARDVETMLERWREAARADVEARRRAEPLLSAVRRALLAALSGRDDVLADFGLTSRRAPIVGREQRVVWAMKAWATRKRKGRAPKDGGGQ